MVGGVEIELERREGRKMKRQREGRRKRKKD